MTAPTLQLDPNTTRVYRGEDASLILQPVQGPHYYSPKGTDLHVIKYETVDGESKLTVPDLGISGSWRNYWSSHRALTLDDKPLPPGESCHVIYICHQAPATQIDFSRLKLAD